LIWSFLVVTLVPLVALIWLAAELVRQDRQLERQRAQALAEDAADRIVAGLHQKAAELAAELRLAAADGTHPPTGAMRVVMNRDRISVTSPGVLVWVPVLPADEAAPHDAFDTGERYEHRENNLSQAIEWFAGLAKSDRPAVRAGALLRLGRTQRKAGQPDAALRTYRALAGLGAVQVEGYPAAVLALEAQCELLEQAGRRDELTVAARALREGLAAGAWPMQRDAYEFYDAEARRWTGEQANTDLDRDARAKAAACQTIYDRWAADGSVPDTEWRIFDGWPILMVAAARRQPPQVSALFAGADYFRGAWDNARDLDVSLADQDGHLLLGATAPANGPRAIRTSDETKLPWTLSVTVKDFGAPGPALARQRRLLAAGLALILLLVGGAAYFSWRGIGHEVAVARLQSDFVAAVSHEFRSPIASIRHLSDMLKSGRFQDGTQRDQAYGFLSRESERLELLVEELLDFGRLESGAYEYHFERLDALALVRAVVADFNENVGAKGYRVELSAGRDEAWVLADRDALRRAIWNLLDNAVKYSPDVRTVWVSVRTEDASVAIEVRDEGLGISPSERRVIFRKFVRGSISQARQIKGTGIGLAMVSHIVEAHRGEVAVHSRPSHGSTFVVRIPVEKPA